MVIDDPRHGSYAGAIQHWKDGEPGCEPCLAAARRLRKSNELRRMAGISGVVPLGQRAWEVIASTPRNQLVASTGMLHDRLHRYLVAGPDRPVLRSTRDRILAAGEVPVWTPVGVQRRLQALAALGWSCQALGEHAGMHATSLAALRRRENPKHVRLPFAEKVLALYDDLHMTVPPAGPSATETRTEALARGWVPPLAWDDIDNPKERPSIFAVRARRPRKTDIDEMVVERAMARDFDHDHTRAERVEITRRWEAAGRSLYELEHLSGWKSERYTSREDGAA